MISVKLAVLTSILIARADAIAPATTNSKYHRNTVTALHLLPTQGCQLAAASEAALVKEEAKKSSIQNTEEEQITPLNAAREVVSRLFSLPSEIMKGPSASLSVEKEMDLPFNVITELSGEDDVVVYPIVGFTFVKHGDESKVLPTSTNAACSIDSYRKSRTEATYGWFSPCCKLGDIHSDEHEAYCGKPLDGQV